jgi:branched-chain amino acid transport system ATP-binding protein
VSKEVYVLDFGRVIAHGTPKQVQDDPDVQAAYLGVELPGGEAPVEVPA